MFCLYLIGAVLQSLLLHFVSLCQGFHEYKQILIKKIDRIGPNNQHPSTKNGKLEALHCTRIVSAVTGKPIVKFQSGKTTYKNYLSNLLVIIQEDCICLDYLIFELN